jgi:alpha-beta hydrolase superfamily lysophospholipase
MASPPSSILLLHGLGGSGEGSVKLLEAVLRERGWDAATYLRPTLATVHAALPARPDEQRFRQALHELEAFLGGRVPHLTLGFSFGGLLAAFAPSPRRLAVCSPWHRLPGEALSRAAASPGWAVLQGGRDTVVDADTSLAALPAGVPRTLDAEGTHGFDDWMDRIAAWTQATWEG